MLYAIKFMPVIVYIKIVIQWGLKILLFMAIVPTARRLYKAKGVKATNTTAVSAHTKLKAEQLSSITLVLGFYKTNSTENLLLQRIYYTNTC